MERSHRARANRGPPQGCVRFAVGFRGTRSPAASLVEASTTRSDRWSERTRLNTPAQTRSWTVRTRAVRTRTRNTPGAPSGERTLEVRTRTQGANARLGHRPSGAQSEDRQRDCFHHPSAFFGGSLVLGWSLLSAARERKPRAEDRVGNDRNAEHTPSNEQRGHRSAPFRTRGGRDGKR
jgi:hypothetical protein